MSHYIRKVITFEELLTLAVSSNVSDYFSVLLVLHAFHNLRLLCQYRPRMVLCYTPHSYVLVFCISNMTSMMTLKAVLIIYLYFLFICYTDTENMHFGLFLCFI